MRIVTDSAATLPEELAAELGVVVVPLRITVDGTTVADGAVPPEALLENVENVKTAGPSPGDFVDAVSRAGPDGAVILTVSHDMAESTYMAARVAARLVDVPVRVVDTASAAGGEGRVVLAAAKAAHGGASLEEVVAVAERAASRVRLVATLPSLDHLVRSGHVPEAAAWAARWAGLRPVVELRRGRVRPHQPALSAAAARRRMLRVWRRSRPGGPAALHVAALHSLAEAEATELLAEVEQEVTPTTSFVGAFGTAMLVHSGPGVVGLAWWWEPQEETPTS